MEVYTIFGILPIAFFFFMSMIPLLIIIFQLLPIFGLSQVDLIKFLDRLMPEAMQGFAAIVVSQAYRYSMETLSLSVVTLVWSASKGTMALRQGLNRVYGVYLVHFYILTFNWFV